MASDRLRHYLNERSETRRLIEIAQRQSDVAYPDRRRMGSGSVFYKGADFVIVCVWWLEPRTRPPFPTWWLVSRDGSCRELSAEETDRFRPVPWVR